MIDGARMTVRLAAHSVSILVWLLAATRAACGQEIYAGYSYLTDASSPLVRAIAEHNDLPAGWLAGAAWQTRDWLAIVADASGHRKTLHTFDSDVKLSYFAAMGGVRASAPIGPLVEFGQVLAGVLYGRGSAFGATVTESAFAIQPGGGVDMPLGRRLRARAEVDLRLINGSADGRQRTHQVRAVAALVYRR
jgi:hypothetical protein